MFLKRRISSIEQEIKKQLAKDNSRGDFDDLMGFLSGEVRKHPSSAFESFYRAEDPDLWLFEELIYIGNPTEVNALHCRAAALSVTAAWESHEDTSERFFRRFDVHNEEFGSLTEALHRNISRVRGLVDASDDPSLHRIRELALRQVCLRPHKIWFPLEDFDLGTWAGYVRSVERIEYDWDSGQYHRMLELRKQVANDPEQQTMIRQIEENRIRRRDKFHAWLRQMVTIPGKSTKPR